MFKQDPPTYVRWTVLFKVVQYVLFQLTCRDEVHILADGVKQQPLKADSQTQTHFQST